MLNTVQNTYSKNACAQPSTLSLIGDAACRVQEALRQAIEDCPQRPAKSGQLAKLLRLDSASTWRIWQTAYSDNEQEAILHLVGDSAMERFLQALHARGSAGEAQCNTVRGALCEFKDVVDEHVGDVNTLKLMIARATPSIFNGDRYSKAMFDSMRYRVGVYGRTTAKIAVQVASQFDGLIDTAEIRLREGVRTLEDNGTYLLNVEEFRETRNSDPRWHMMACLKEPLGQIDPDAEVPEGATPLPVLPEVTRLNGRSVWTRSEGGTDRYFMSGGFAGARGETSVAFGTMIRAYAPSFGPLSETGVGTEPFIPFENQLVEFYVNDAQVRAGLVPAARLYELMYSDSPFPGRLIRTEAGVIEHYKPGLARPAPQEVAGHAAATRALEQVIGQSFSELHLYRWRVRYPIVGVHYALHAKAGE